MSRFLLTHEPRLFMLTTPTDSLVDSLTGTTASGHAMDPLPSGSPLSTPISVSVLSVTTDMGSSSNPVVLPAPPPSSSSVNDQDGPIAMWGDSVFPVSGERLTATPAQQMATASSTQRPRTRPKIPPHLPFPSPPTRTHLTPTTPGSSSLGLQEGLGPSYFWSE